MYVYKLASHDKCQYAILNKEQKDTTDSRRVSSPPLTCRDTRTLTRRAIFHPLSSLLLLLPAGFSSPCVFTCSVERRKC